LVTSEQAALNVADANLRAARAAKLLGDETADVAGALSLQVLEMESLLGTLNPTSEAYLRLAESIAAAKDEMLKLNNTKLTALDFAGTISSAVAGLAVTMIDLASAGADVARNVALAFAEMAQSVLNQILKMAIAELVLQQIRTALAASSPFTAWMIFGLAAGALAAGALVAQLRSMGAKSPAPITPPKTPVTPPTPPEPDTTPPGTDTMPFPDNNNLGRVAGDVNFGAISQSLQFGIATPLLDASENMLDAAMMMKEAFSGMLPSAPNLGEVMSPFTNVLERMTPVLERLLVEGVSINVGAGDGTLMNRNSALRGFV